MIVRSFSLAALQRAALTDLHPAWLPRLSPALLARAVPSPAGRAMLSQMLSGQGRALFTRLVATPAEAALPLAQPWLFNRLSNADALLSDLGAASWAPTLRAVVVREEVLRLRRVLGESRYRDLLTRPVGQPPSAAEPAAEDIVAAFENDDALTIALQRRGAQELAAFAAAQLPDVASERVQLAFDPAWMQSTVTALSVDELRAQLLAHGGLRSDQAALGAAA